jgi:arylsulfatase A-like enzyme
VNTVKKPNILLICTDQQKASALGCYGNRIVRTPAMDRLAGEGVKFNQAFTVCPLCVPSRCSIVTGRYPHVHGSDFMNSILLRPSETNLVQLLRNEGYHTALVGKNHCFRKEESQRLFHEVYPAEHGGIPNPTDEEMSVSMAFQRSKQFNGSVITGVNSARKEKCTTYLIGERAVQLLEEMGRQASPFFIQVSFPDPHPPYQAPEPYASMYDPEQVDLPVQIPDEFNSKPANQRRDQIMMGMDRAAETDLRKAIAMYYGMITFIDDQIARLLDTMETLHLDEETLVVFLSDHGDYMGEHGMIRKSNALYDCLVRIPLIVRWKGRIEAQPGGREELIESIDLMPTLLELLGIPASPGVQGKAFTPLLSNREEPYEPRSHVFSECGTAGDFATIRENGLIPDGPWDSSVRPWPSFHEAYRGKIKMVRNHEWKYVHYLNGEGELYNLKEDPHELMNLYGSLKHKQILRELEHELLNWCIRSEAPNET